MGDAEVLIKFKADTSDVKSKTDQVSSGIENLTSKLTLANIAAEAFSTGMRLVSSGLDDAIARVDTMNNFPRVMSNLGISAEESAEVIDDLSEKLQGLPTTLDEAAMSVQRLTSKNGDIKKSEQIYLAMNNAILAGGAPAATQSAAIEQLSQAYAKGKPDMMEWRTIMTAMPAQLKQVATAMGYVDADALGEALRNGNVSMDEFMNTMIQLNQEGLEGFPSLEEQARNATGGISTSVKNMKTAFVRGIADILTSIDEALAPMGGISGVLQKIGKIGEKAFKKIGDVLKVVIPKLIEIGKWIKKNKAWIEPLTAAIATFVVTFATIKKVISIINSVKTAFMALKLVMATNPFALIIAGIAALVVGFIYLWNNCEEFRNFWIGLWNGIKTIVKTVIDTIVGIIKGIVNVIKGVIDKIMNVVKPIIDFYVSIYTSIFNALKSFIETVLNVLSIAWNTITGVLKTVINFVKKYVIDPVLNVFKTLWNTVVSLAQGAWNGITGIFSGFVNFFRGIFEGAWNAIQSLFNAGGDIFNGIVNGVADIFTKVVNGLIDGINWIIAKPFEAINGILKTIKKVSIAGFKPFKWVSTIDIPEIPHLSVGTNFVPDDMLAMIHKGEAVVPKKFNPYANNFNASTLGSLNNSRNNQIIIVNANFKQNSLGQTVRDIKTFSGGARNDYNYGM